MSTEDLSSVSDRCAEIRSAILDALRARGEIDSSAEALSTRQLEDLWRARIRSLSDAQAEAEAIDGRAKLVKGACDIGMDPASLSALNDAVIESRVLAEIAGFDRGTVAWLLRQFVFAEGATERTHGSH